MSFSERTLIVDNSMVDTIPTQIRVSLESRFVEHGEVTSAALAHADRRTPAKWYFRGLILPGDRQSVEPMAARAQPQNVRSAHQSIHPLCADAGWRRRRDLSHMQRLAVRWSPAARSLHPCPEDRLDVRTQDKSAVQ
jgi:hypothetical protein